MPSYSGVWSLPAVYQAVAQGNWPVPPLTGDIGLFGGGGGSTNSIEYILITNISNANDFGDLTQGRSNLAACSSSTRGVFGGGGATNIIDYVTILSKGNATDFGDLISATNDLAASSSSTRGLFGGGGNAGTYTNVIQYITIDSTGNATDFGDLSQNRNDLSSCSSATRSVFGGGFQFSGGFIYYNVIDYVTIATTGNATDFGDLLATTFALTAFSSSTRGVFAGGETNVAAINVIQYVTIASVGNATDFGDLTFNANNTPGGTSNSTRGIIGGGGLGSNVIQYVTIASTGNATDFGDLIQTNYDLSACSNAHGGLA